MTIPMRLYFLGNRDYSVGSISFDLLVSESHSFTNEVSEFNIEDGSTISDHIRNNLENGSLTGLISNFSINSPGASSNRSQDAFDALIKLWQEKSLVTIVTVMRVYENMAITDISVDRSSDTGEAIILNISFRKVNIVKLKSVLIDLSVSVNNTGNDLNRQVSPKAEIGRTQGVVQ